VARAREEGPKHVYITNGQCVHIEGRGAVVGQDALRREDGERPREGAFVRAEPSGRARCIGLEQARGAPGRQVDPRGQLEDQTGAFAAAAALRFLAR
jgi:hypothetical protein